MAVARQQLIKQISGPLPDPNTFREYDLIVPGAAERILNMAEADATHTRDMEKRAMSADHREGMLARVCAGVIPLTGIAAAAVIALYGGSAWVAGILGGGALSAPLIAAILRDRGADKGR